MAGRYEVLRIAGAGAVARVLHVRRNDGAELALKVLRPENVRDPVLVRRFRDEARILRQIHHSNVVRGHRLLDYDGRLVLEMEWVEGCNLEEMVQHHEPLSVDVALATTYACAEALDAVWNAVGDRGRPLRILHRDLKPGNVAVTTDGRVKLLDFGYAKGDITGRAAQSVYDAWGTMGFDAPERRRGAHGQASDVYALGVSLFVVLTGSPLLLSTKPDAHREGVARGLKHLSNSDVADIIRAMLAFEPSQRITYPELLARIEALCPANRRQEALAAFGETAVSDRVASRVAIAPQKDFSWREVEFLEQVDPTPEPEPLSREVARERLSRLTRLPDWPDRVGEIEPIMDAATDIDPEVFVALLRNHTVPWYRPGASATPADQLVAALLLLDRIEPELAQQWAREVQEHPVERVRDAVAHVLRSQ